MNFRLQSAQRAVRDVQAEGFRDGAQGIAPTALPEELRAMFAQAREAVLYNAAEQIKRLEALVVSIELRVAVMNERWGKLTTELGELPPALILPLCAILSAALVIIGEAIFLAPVMDGFGISEYYEQRCLAAVIVLVASGAFEISKKLFHRLARSRSSHAPVNIDEPPSEIPPPQPLWVERAIFVAFALLTALSFVFVCILGWWRAEEMAFAATVTDGAMQNGQWSRFLTDHLPLTRSLIILFALMLPIFVAFAFEWGADNLRLAREWRKVRRALDRLPQERESAAKAFEAQVEKRDCQLKSLDEKQAEWTQAYKQTYELGEKIGAWRLPLWQIVVKIIAITLLVAALCFAVNLLISNMTDADWFITQRYVIALFVTLGAGSIHAYRALQAWDRPTPQQLYDQRATLWLNAGRAKEPKPISQRVIASGLDAISSPDAERLPSSVLAASSKEFARVQAVTNNGHGTEHR